MKNLFWIVGLILLTSCATAKSTDNIAGRQNYFESQTMQNLRNLQKGIQSLAGTTGALTQKVDAQEAKQADLEKKIDILAQKVLFVAPNLTVPAAVKAEEVKA